MSTIPESQEIKGEEKTVYLQRLDRALASVVTFLKSSKGFKYSEALKEFGQRENWDWSRLQQPAKAILTLGDLAERVRQEYQWFDWLVHPTDSARNRGYFDSLELSTSSGLPSPFAHLGLERLKEEAETELKELPDYEALAKQLHTLLMSDYIEAPQVSKKANGLHRQALQRSFLEQLNTAQLLSWRSGGGKEDTTAERVLTLGIEELWTVKAIRYSKARGYFHAYVIDLWQNVNEPVLVAEDDSEQGILNPELRNALNFGEENEAWYMIQSINQRFASLFPVYVTRLLIGPFENKYLTKPHHVPLLDISNELLAEDRETAILRLSRQYGFAPNQVIKEGMARPKVYREDWRDEIIVCPARYSSRVAKAIVGTELKIITY